MERNVFVLSISTFIAPFLFLFACEGGAETGGKNSTPNNPGNDGATSADAGGNDNGLPPVGNDTANVENDSTHDIDTINPIEENIFVKVLPGEYVFHAKSGDAYMTVSVLSIDTLPSWPGACSATAIGWLKLQRTDIEAGYELTCLEPDGSLSLCKENAYEICDGYQTWGRVYLGTCAFSGGATSLVRCARTEDCSGGGYCNTTTKEVVIDIHLMTCGNGGCVEDGNPIYQKVD